MKPKFFIAAIASIVFAFVIFVSCTDYESGGVFNSQIFETVYMDSCFVLFAGQSLDVGTVCVTLEDDGMGSQNLVVTYVTTGGWELLETHLWIGQYLSDMPQTRKGNPKVGHFPYTSGDLSGTPATTYAFIVPIADLGGESGLCDQTWLFAAHAALGLPDGSGGYQQMESGWANGERMVSRGNWATYFALYFDCDNPQPGGLTCDAAFAYGGTDAQCFLDIDEDGDGVGDFYRWGWSNGALGAGTYNFDIYAGAGQCELTNGTLVGDVTVVYDAVTGDVTVTYNMDSGWGLHETNLYVGCEVLPRNVNNLYTVAPSQYGNIHEELEGASTDTYTINVTCASGIYVVAHAVVCEIECDPTVGIVYGMERYTGDVYAIDLVTGTTTFSFSSIVPNPGSATPNGLAYDFDNARMYYCNYPTVTTLYFWDYANNVETLAGVLSHSNGAADFYGGKYYYIAAPSRTDDLYEVSFNPDGTILSEVKIADIAGGAHAWSFSGDIAVKDGVLYGWGYCGIHSPHYEFFTYDLGTAAFAVYTTGYQTSLQLGFGSNSAALYGHRSGAPGNFYEIDITDGSISAAIYSDGTLYTDCASGHQCP